VLYDVAYAEHLSRLTSLVRVILAIPVFIALSVVGYVISYGVGFGMITVFLKRKYPGWLFAATSGALGFQARSYAYALLLTDRYPSFGGEDSPVTLEYETPPSGQLSRWRVLIWKAILLIPHFVVLFFLAIATIVVVILAWFAILFTGRYPRGMFGFVVGVQRWYFRVTGYFASFNDRFPPFALSARAGPGSNASAIICGIVGLILVGAAAGGGIAIAIVASDTDTATVDYAAFRQGAAQPVTFVSGGFDDPDFTVRLDAVRDPDTAVQDAFDLAAGERVVTFEIVYDNRTGRDRTVRGGAFRLRYSDDDGSESERPTLLLVGGDVAPAEVAERSRATITAVFVIPEEATPTRLTIDPPWPSLKKIGYDFE
jgi:hypothetical protein